MLLLSLVRFINGTNFFFQYIKLLLEINFSVGVWFTSQFIRIAMWKMETRQRKVERSLDNYLVWHKIKTVL